MSTAPAVPAVPKLPKEDVDSVILVSFPKIVFLWPSYLVALVAALYMNFSTGSATAISADVAGATVIGWTFLILLSLNLIVLSFDFPRTTSLTLFFVIVACVLGGFLAVIYFPNLFPRV